MFHKGLGPQLRVRKELYSESVTEVGEDKSYQEIDRVSQYLGLHGLTNEIGWQAFSIV